MRGYKNKQFLPQQFLPWRTLSLATFLVALLGLLTVATPALAQGDADASDDEKSAVEGEEKAGEEKAGEDSSTKPDSENPFEGVAPSDDPFAVLLEEISGNMKRIEELLNQGDTSSATQGLQTKTITKIDELIKECEKCMNGSSGGQGMNGQPKPGPQSQQDQKLPGQQRQLSEREMLEKQRQEQKKQKSEQAKNDQDSEQVPNNRTSEGEMPPVEVGDLKKAGRTGRWGKLPKRVIEQMYDNGQFKLPEKYRLVLEAYFSTLPTSN